MVCSSAIFEPNVLQCTFSFCDNTCFSVEGALELTIGTKMIAGEYGYNMFSTFISHPVLKGFGEASLFDCSS